MVTGTPLASRVASISAGARVGAALRRSAAHPAAWGEAWLVPYMTEKVPPRPSDRMAAPGAKTSVVLLLSEKQVTLSAWVVLSMQEAGGPYPTPPMLAS